METHTLAFPARTLADADSMDSDSQVSGYRDGCSGRRPRDSGRSYMHGWRCGANDRAGRAEPWQRDLARQLFADRGCELVVALGALGVKC